MGNVCPFIKVSRPATTVLTAPRNIGRMLDLWLRCRCGTNSDLEHEKDFDCLIAHGIPESDLSFLVHGALENALVESESSEGRIAVQIRRTDTYYLLGI